MEMMKYPLAKSGLCLRTDRIKDTENKNFLFQFKTRSFEGFANFRELDSLNSLNLGKI